MRLAVITDALVLCAPLAYAQNRVAKSDGIKWEPMPEMLVQADGDNLP